MVLQNDDVVDLFRMIVDYKKFMPGQNLQPNTLWILEQIPGKCES
jgi:hypothetical protein